MFLVRRLLAGEGFDVGECARGDAGGSLTPSAQCVAEEGQAMTTAAASES
jgi:hypothetical protein